MPPSKQEQRTNQWLTTYLEGLSRDCITVLNMRDFDHNTPLGRKVRRHISADYSIFLDNTHPMSFEECNNMYSLAGDIQFRLIELSAEVDAAKGRAIVFQKLDLKGWQKSSETILKIIASQRW